MTGKATFAKRLREAREAKGISQKQLGILVGIDQFVASARINQYERGKHVPDLLMAERLAHELGVPVSFFYEPHENLARLLQLACFLHPDRLQAILRQLSDELQLPK